MTDLAKFLPDGMLTVCISVATMSAITTTDVVAPWWTLRYASSKTSMLSHKSGACSRMHATTHWSVISTTCNKGATGHVLNLNSSLEVVIVHRWQVYAGEQITQDPIEEGNILVQKLRQVDIIDGP